MKEDNAIVWIDEDGEMMVTMTVNTLFSIANDLRSNGIKKE